MRRVKSERTLRGLATDRAPGDGIASRRGATHSLISLFTLLPSLFLLELPRVPPTEPANTAATFRTLHGFRMDLLAAEPLVTDPVAIEYDEDGRAYVVEMSDYPNTDQAADRPFTERTADLPIGRVRLLEDLDGDGKFDRSTIFVEGLSWPTGVAVWRGGIFVAATPDIWYFKDTDGDCKADVRRRVFTGFRKFNVQSTMNNLKWGLDGWIYGAGGSNGGAITHIPPDLPPLPGTGRGGQGVRGERSPALPSGEAERRLPLTPGPSPPPGARGEGKPIALGTNDYRFHPDTEQFEIIPGGARFGMTFDDWGNRFICNIRNPVQHVVLPAEALRRNPHLAVRTAVHDAAEAGDTLPVFRSSPPEAWRVANAQRLARDTTVASPRSESTAAGYMTSACGITIYRGSAYPPEFYGNVFLAEVAGNLIHRQILKPNGVTFTSTRADPDTEFVTSTDNWFRPVNFINAPDGTLHVLDMYRETIEHPWSIPDDIRAQLDLSSGRDRGRIYRLSPPNFKVPLPPKLSQATTAELVAHLANANSWWRETAQRLLIERKDPAAVAALRHQLSLSLPGERVGVRGPNDHNASIVRFDLGHLHSLWTLHNLKQLRADDLFAALKNPSQGVRANAARVVASFKSEQALFDHLIALVNDDDVRVRFQVAIALGAFDDSRVANALAGIAAHDAVDEWVRAALVSSGSTRAAETALAVYRTNVSYRAEGLQLLRELSTVVGSRNEERELRLLAKGVADFGERESATRRRVDAVLLGFADGLRRSKQRLTDVSKIEPRLQTWIASAGAGAIHAANRDGSEGERAEQLQAIAWLGYSELSQARATLAGLLGARQRREVQSAAVNALCQLADANVPDTLLAAIRGSSPGLRTELIVALLSRPEWISPLLDAIEAGTVSATDVPLARRNLLLRNANAAIKERSLKLFAREAAGPREAVLKEYQAALSLAGDAGRGQKVFQRECRQCHRVGDDGFDVGPSLATVRHRGPDEILLHVLDPNREVGPNFVEYVVVLNDGRTATGLIASETPTSITLRRAEGATETILRREIDEVSSTGKSLMPEGVEKKITVAEMAELLVFLRGGK